MKKILVTAFDPFGGDLKNSSLLVLEALPDVIEDIEIVKLNVPTVYVKCADIAWEMAKSEKADVILSMGQAGGREAPSVELAALNYADAGLRDNEGNLFTGEKLFKDGKDGYFSTLPVKAMTEAIKKLGFNSYVSLSAGGFVCNSMLYTLLKHADDEKSEIKCGFLHLPYAKEQNKNAFSMETGEMVRCVSEAIKSSFAAF